MTNFSLYRKELEMLEITKDFLSKGQYHGGYRESIAELFFENDHHLRQDFLELIPVDKLENIKKLLFFLKNVYSSTNGNGNKTIGAYMCETRYVKDVIKEISELQNLIKTQCNARFKYGVFYSWQSDSSSSYNRNFIELVLEKAIKEVNKKIVDGPLISLDKDTRDVPGSPDITPTIMQKIDRV